MPPPKGRKNWGRVIHEYKLFYFINLFLLPVSVIYDLWSWCSILFNFYFVSNRGLAHDQRVKDVQRQVSEWRKATNGEGPPMCTARPSWKSITPMDNIEYKKRLYGIKIDLPDIIELDEKKKKVRVEPMVTIGQLNDFLIRRGWTLPVVPELDDLTIGGLIMGAGLETTSHKYGLFQNLATEFEVVVADGSVIKCNKDNDPELFVALPLSYGTLGFLTAIELPVITYKPYIKMRYTAHKNLDDLVKDFTDATYDPEVDSAEGLVYSKDTGVVMRGYFCEDYQRGKLNHIGRWYKKWYYSYVEDILNRPKDVEDFVEYYTTVDFNHRHNRAYFWLMQYFVPFGNNVVFRYLFGWLMPLKHCFLKWIRTFFPVNKEDMWNFLSQDFIYDIKDLKHALVYCNEEPAVYPVWLCPSRSGIHPDLLHLSKFDQESMGVDVGIYGFTSNEEFDKDDWQRRMETDVIDRQGYVAMYAETLFTREQYAQMSGRWLDTYEKVRKRLNCEGAFPHVYYKISAEGREKKKE